MLAKKILLKKLAKTKMNCALKKIFQQTRQTESKRSRRSSLLMKPLLKLRATPMVRSFIRLNGPRNLVLGPV